VRSYNFHLLSAALAAVGSATDSNGSTSVALLQAHNDPPPAPLPPRYADPMQRTQGFPPGVGRAPRKGRRR
jgi:hypothetical protein